MDCFIFENAETGEVIAVEDEDLERAHDTAVDVFCCAAIYVDCMSTEEAKEEGFDIY